MATRASEVNKGTRGRRAAAAKGQPGYIDVDGKLAKSKERTDAAWELIRSIIDMRKRREEIREKAKEVNMGAKALTKEITAALDRGEEWGFTRDNLKEMSDFALKSEEERIKNEAGRALLVRACGWVSGQQIDAFNTEIDAIIATAKNDGNGELAEGQADAIAAHIAKHGTTEQTH